jgi:FtsP/CotA-like multicopper oxidase with cupredoxin domain
MKTPGADDTHAAHNVADAPANNPAASEPTAHAAHGGHDSHEMQFDSSGMVMNSNLDRLPLNCAAISEDFEFTVYGGTQYAQQFPQRTFAYSEHEFKVPPCSRVRINFVNDDQVRHQWMLHGLPRYLYPQGMFHLEAAGGKTVSGSFIVPADDATYLIHCDITQHMEKGMKAQLLVGKGSGNLWSVPGVSQNFLMSREIPRIALILIAAGLMIATGLSAIMISAVKSR